jgi:hypothetical protein
MTKLTQRQAQHRNWQIMRLRGIESALPSDMPWSRRVNILSLVDQQLRDMGALDRSEHRDFILSKIT